MKNRLSCYQYYSFTQTKHKHFHAHTHTQSLHSPTIVVFFYHCQNLHNVMSLFQDFHVHTHTHIHTQVHAHARTHTHTHARNRLEREQTATDNTVNDGVKLHRPKNPTPTAIKINCKQKHHNNLAATNQHNHRRGGIRSWKTGRCPSHTVVLRHTEHRAMRDGRQFMYNEG